MYVHISRKAQQRVRVLSRRSTVLFTTLAILVLAIGLGSTYKLHHVNAEADAIAAQKQQTGEAPSTQKPSAAAVSSYQVPATAPRYISIPKLSVHAVVRSLGVNTDNELRAPSNVFETGWYNQSALPGQPGATVIDGHVSSWKTEGVFYGLTKLKPGDALAIERGDGSRVNYVVRTVKTYDASSVDMAAALRPVNPTASGLNLITCAGNVIKGTSTFDKRLVVFAEQV